MSAGLGRLFNRVAGTAHGPVSKLQLVAAWPVSSRIVLRPSQLGSSPLTVSRTAATSSRTTTRVAAGKKTSTTPTKKAATTKRAAATKKATVTKKRTVAKKTIAGKARKAAPKRKATVKKKTAVKRKAASKKAVKKTPEQKEKQKIKAAELRLKERKNLMKALALKPPHSEPGRQLSAVNVYFGEKAAGQAKPSAIMATIHKDWKGLPEAEKQRYSEISRARTEERRKAYRKFIESCTPEEIRKANIARTWLRNHGCASYPALEDHRLPKRVVSSFFHFLEDLRKKDPEIMALPLTEKSKVAGQKWKSLTPQEKKPYDDLFQDAAKKYHAERTALFSS